MAAQAADFPIKDKPVTLIVPFAAGGPTDRVARDLAEAMRKSLGVSVVKLIVSARSLLLTLLSLAKWLPCRKRWRSGFCLDVVSSSTLLHNSRLLLSNSRLLVTLL